MEKIQELTDKLYREGVEKGTEDGNRLVEQAKRQADEIVTSARQQADEIVASARKQAEELDKNTRSELKLYAGQALNALKSEIVNVVSGVVTKKAASELTGNKDFMGRFMVALAKEWSAEGKVQISASDADTLTAYFKKNAKDLLDKGLKIKKVNGRDASFSIGPADGSYKVNFGEEEFEAYFKDFLRPKLNEMLFDK